MCSWLPVDTVASAILELAGISCVSGSDDVPFRTYNILNPHSFSWDDFLHSLRAAGLSFSTVRPDQWLDALAKNGSEDDTKHSPAIKLLGFLQDTFSIDGQRKGPQFDMKSALQDSMSLRHAPDLLQEGYINKFVQCWLQQWNRESCSGG